jgi:hypothetical protein
VTARHEERRRTFSATCTTTAELRPSVHVVQPRRRQSSGPKRSGREDDFRTDRRRAEDVGALLAIQLCGLRVALDDSKATKTPIGHAARSPCTCLECRSTETLAKAGAQSLRSGRDGVGGHFGGLNFLEAGQSSSRGNLWPMLDCLQPSMNSDARPSSSMAMQSIPISSN